MARIAAEVMRIAGLLMLLTLAGCGGASRGGAWPTLAPRAGEVSPMVPRTRLGACSGCGTDVFAAPEATPTAVTVPVPADVPARIDAVETAIAEVAAELPAARGKAEAANAAAQRGGDAATEAEVQRSRLESLFLPLAGLGSTLNGIDDDLAGADGGAPLQARVDALRQRLQALDAERAALTGSP